MRLVPLLLLALALSACGAAVKTDRPAGTATDGGDDASYTACAILTTKPF